MKRHIFLIIILLSLSQVSFSQTSEIDLSINGQPIELTQPIIQSPSGRLLAPLEEFFGLLRVPIDELPNNQMVVFRDNIFLKFRPGQSRYEINGREQTWTVTPYYIGDTLYVPVEVFLHYMDFGASFNQDTNQLDIRTTKALDSFRPESSALKQVPSLGTGLMYSVPTYWERLETDGYGTRLFNQRILIHLQLIPSHHSNLSDVIRDYLAGLNERHEGFQAKPIKTVETSLFTATVHQYDLVLPRLPADQEQHVIRYGFFELNDQFFVAVLDSNLRDPAFLDQVMQDILLSIQSKSYSIDSLSEHYVEFRNYSQFGTFIATPIYSNIQIAGELPFRGNIDPSIEYLNVTVQKGTRRFEYQVPVVYGAFDESIPIPFGLGFHRVSISLPETIAGQEDLYLLEDDSTLIKFSVINRSLGDSLYVSSSLWVNKNHEEVQAAIKDIPDELTNYDKARQAFQLMEQFDLATNQTMDKLLIDRKGSSQAIASLYTAYLRAMNVPSRIMKDPEQEEYFVEFFSNGKWVFTRPASYARIKGTFGYYFDVPRPKGILLQMMDV